jgi:hypothetical protein
MATILIAGWLAGCADYPSEPVVGNDPAGPLSAPATVTVTNLVSPLAFSEWVSCANGGLGEEVIVTGRLHETLHVTVTAKGNAQIKLHFQPQGVKGVGVTTGVVWAATGVTQEIATARLESLAGAVNTFVNNFRLIGPGPGNNLVLHHVRHFTINANGTVTVERGNEIPEVSCGKEGPGGDH